MKLKFLMTLLFGILITMGVKAQNVALKTNILYDATATINAINKILIFIICCFCCSDYLTHYKGKGLKGRR